MRAVATINVATWFHSSSCEQLSKILVVYPTAENLLLLIEIITQSLLDRLDVRDGLVVLRIDP